MTNQIPNIPHTLIGYISNCSLVPAGTLFTVDWILYQDIKQLIPNDPNGLVFYQKATYTIIVPSYIYNVISPGYHGFMIHPNTPQVTYLGPANIQYQPFSYNNNDVIKGDRLIIVGKKHNGVFAKYVSRNGSYNRSINVQLEKERFSPSINSVRVIKLVQPVVVPIVPVNPVKLPKVKKERTKSVKPVPLGPNLGLVYPNIEITVYQTTGNEQRVFVSIDVRQHQVSINLYM